MRFTSVVIFMMLWALACVNRAEARPDDMTPTEWGVYRQETALTIDEIIAASPVIEPVDANPGHCLLEGIWDDHNGGTTVFITQPDCLYWANLNRSGDRSAGDIAYCKHGGQYPGLGEVVGFWYGPPGFQSESGWSPCHDI